MSQSPDRLYELLPVVYRQRDAEQGYPLRELLRVIGKEVDIVEDNISQLYENWFIETCEDWVVPYIGDLIGYRPVHEAGEPGEITTPQGRERNKILIPRREVANTIRYRRRKGTLALLELLAKDVAGWPARAVEFYKLLGWTQHVKHLRPMQGRTVDLREMDTLDLLDGSFDRLAHTVDVRRITSHHQQGRYSIPNVGVFVWRLKAYSVTQAPAYCLEEVSPNCFTFSVLGNDTPLYNRPQPETDPTHIAEELNLPTPIRRRAFEQVTMQDGVPRKYASTKYYGEEKSLAIWAGDWTGNNPDRPIPAQSIVPADLSDWQYQPPPGTIAVDPELGRIVFPPERNQQPTAGVKVSYHYGFSADTGGGEYDRLCSQPANYALYRVGRRGDFDTINQALEQWLANQQTNPELEKFQHAVIEITDSRAYTERLQFNGQFSINLGENQSLQIRAASRTRPVLRLLDYRVDIADPLRINLKPGSRFTLDGLLLVGRSVQVSQATPEPIEEEGTEKQPAVTAPIKVAIRHSTLVPGWTLHCDCEPKHPVEPSLELFDLNGKVEIEHSIVGSIQVNQDEVQTDPIPIYIRDSILDATSPEQAALDAPGCGAAHAQLTILRSTVFGQILAHSVELAENSIFDGIIKVARSQIGCMRFCYVLPSSHTPRRFNCQPDLVETAIAKDLIETAADSGNPKPTETELEAAKQRERDRVRPQFNSTRYGTPTYCQLANTCAEEIKRGADDESEMGVFHDLYQPQRADNLRARLEEYTPAGMEVGIIYAS